MELGVPGALMTPAPRHVEVGQRREREPVTARLQPMADQTAQVQALLLKHAIHNYAQVRVQVHNYCTFEVRRNSIQQKGFEFKPFITVDGAWGTWSAWATCSKSCGSGTRTRTRNCNDPAPANGGASCAGDNSESQNCNTQACPGKTFIWAATFGSYSLIHPFDYFLVPGNWGSWNAYSTCSVTCGDGTQTRCMQK